MRIKYHKKRITKCRRCSKCEVLDTNVECLSYREVEAVEYFKLSGMTYGDTNTVSQSV